MNTEIPRYSIFKYIRCSAGDTEVPMYSIWKYICCPRKYKGTQFGSTFAVHRVTPKYQGTRFGSTCVVHGSTKVLDLEVHSIIQTLSCGAPIGAEVQRYSIFNNIRCHDICKVWFRADRGSKTNFCKWGPCKGQMTVTASAVQS